MTVIISQPKTTQSALRALSLIEELARSATPLRPQALANRLTLSLPTTIRLLRTLCFAGYVERDGRGYALTSKVSLLSQAIEGNLLPRERHLDAMRLTADGTGETVFLSDWYRGDARTCAVVEGRSHVRVAGVYVGLTGDAYARASGIALLAFGPPVRRSEYLSRNTFDRLTPGTICSRTALEKELAIVATRGYAIDREGFLPQVSCIAIPLASPGTTADTVLTVTVPSERFEANLSRYLATMRQAAMIATRAHSPQAAVDGRALGRLPGEDGMPLADTPLHGRVARGTGKPSGEAKASERQPEPVRG